MGRKVIIVEDDYALSRLILATLQAVGCDVLATVATGEEAVELVARAEPDVVVMDVGLAGKIDGIEAARRLRRSSRCPVVFHTAFGDPEHTAKMRAVARSAIVRKPCDIGRLVEAVENASALTG